MRIFTVAFFPVLLHHAALLSKKCCDTNSYLRKNDTVYFCDKDEDRRLQIFTNDTDFWRHAGDGTCFDTYPNITEFKIRNRTVVEERPISVNFYPKCCPLGYFYHSVAHSCVQNDGLDSGFITQNFVRVGLPHCRLIVDYRLNPSRDRLELGNLYIDKNASFVEGQFCVDRDENDTLVARGCHDDLSVCYSGVKCVHKCCPDGQSFVNGQKCRNTYEHGLNLSFTDRVNNSQDPFAIIHRYDCRIYILEKKIQFYLNTDGTFHVYYNISDSFLRFGIEDKSYCIEHIKKGSLNRFEFLMCFPNTPIQGKFLITRWAKIISSVFIVVTIAVYIFLPEMLNLFGKILLSYCAAMLTLYGSLAYVQFKPDLSDGACVAASFLFSYMSLASFSWLNVMCFDIYWTFGTPKSFKTAFQRKNELKRFLLYSMYGWGLAGFITSFTYLAYDVLDTPYVVRPILGSFKCFWERRPGNYGMFLYYVTPLICMEVANLFLFMRTVFYCLKVKSEINNMNDTRKSVKEKRKYYNVDKEQLLLIIKLSVTMGISFVFEVVSSLFNFGASTTTEYIEIIFDTINCLQGVFIFLIFICKARVFKLCRNRLVTAKDQISLSSLPTATSQLSEPLNSKYRYKN